MINRTRKITALEQDTRGPRDTPSQEKGHTQNTPQEETLGRGSKSYRPAQSCPQTHKGEDSEMAAARYTRKNLVRADRSKGNVLAA